MGKMLRQVEYFLRFSKDQNHTRSKGTHITQPGLSKALDLNKGPSFHSILNSMEKQKKNTMEAK